MDPADNMPDKRFSNYEELFNTQGVSIGFTIPGSDFLFKYDQDGGWKDQKGNYYNSSGVLQKQVDHISDEEDEEVIDHEQLEQFENMLDDGKDNKQKQKGYGKKHQIESYETQTEKLLQNYIKKNNLRENIPSDLFIYFKMRTKFFESIQLRSEKATSLQQIRKFMKQNSDKLKITRDKLKEQNKWIGQNTLLQYSGSQPDDKTYGRYWFGLVKAKSSNYSSIIMQIKESSEFALLQRKTYFALESKFYKKKKMRENVEQFKKKINDFPETSLVKFTVQNLPENFPVSFILDLFTFSGVDVSDLYHIEIIDDFAAEVLLNKKGALNFVSIEGYCHDDRQYVVLEIEEVTGRESKKQNWFQIGLQKNTKYKMHKAELHDVLCLNISGQGLVKTYTEQQEKKNGGFRFIVDQKQLLKVLMFRGSSLNVLKISSYRG